MNRLPRLLETVHVPQGMNTQDPKPSEVCESARGYSDDKPGGEGCINGKRGRKRRQSGPHRCADDHARQAVAYQSP